MCEGFDHGGEEHDDVFLFKGVLPAAEVGFEVGDALFHLNVALLTGVDLAPLFLQGIGAPVLDNIGVGILLNLGEQLYFLPENELGLLIVEAYFLDTFDIVLLIIDLINYTIAGAYYVADPEVIVQLSISTYEFHCFIVHHDYTYNQIQYHPPHLSSPQPRKPRKIAVLSSCTETGTLNGAGSRLGACFIFYYGGLTIPDNNIKQHFLVCFTPASSSEVPSSRLRFSSSPSASSDSLGSGRY